MKTINRKDLDPKVLSVIQAEEKVGQNGNRQPPMDWYLQPDGTLRGLDIAHRANHQRQGKPASNWIKIV